MKPLRSGLIFLIAKKFTTNNFIFLRTFLAILSPHKIERLKCKTNKRRTKILKPKKTRMMNEKQKIFEDQNL
jgi:hypothetical protein